MSLFRSMILFVMDILETVVFVGSMFIVVYLFILQPNQVKGQSMSNTFQDKDYIFTNKLTYKLRKPARGDVVVFNAPKAQGQDYTVEYIKRIIGLPGDHIIFKDCTESYAEYVNCDVELNGKIIQEPYIKAKTKLFFNAKYKEDEEVTIPEGQVFVMGDNRPGSLDSRVFGPISQAEIIGTVFFRYLPVDVIGSVRTDYPDLK